MEDASAAALRASVEVSIALRGGGGGKGGASRPLSSRGSATSGSEIYDDDDEDNIDDEDDERDDNVSDGGRDQQGAGYRAASSRSLASAHEDDGVSLSDKMSVARSISGAHLPSSSSRAGSSRRHHHNQSDVDDTGTFADAASYVTSRTVRSVGGSPVAGAQPLHVPSLRAVRSAFDDATTFSDGLLEGHAALAELSARLGLPVAPSSEREGRALSLSRADFLKWWRKHVAAAQIAHEVRERQVSAAQAPLAPVPAARAASLPSAAVPSPSGTRPSVPFLTPSRGVAPGLTASDLVGGRGTSASVASSLGASGAGGGVPSWISKYRRGAPAPSASGAGSAVSSSMSAADEGSKWNSASVVTTSAASSMVIATLGARRTGRAPPESALVAAAVNAIAVVAGGTDLSMSRGVGGGTGGGGRVGVGGGALLPFPHFPRIPAACVAAPGSSPSDGLGAAEGLGLLHVVSTPLLSREAGGFEGVTAVAQEAMAASASAIAGALHEGRGVGVDELLAAAHAEAGATLAVDLAGVAGAIAAAPLHEHECVLVQCALCAPAQNCAVY